MRRRSIWGRLLSRRCARIDDFAVTIFTIGNEGLETLSTFIYADARKGGLTPELRPLSTIIFVTVLVLLIVINKRAEKSKS